MRPLRPVQARAALHWNRERDCPRLRAWARFGCEGRWCAPGRSGDCGHVRLRRRQSGEPFGRVPRPGPSDLRRPLEPGHHARLGVEVGEDRDPGADRSRTVPLVRAEPRAASLHPFARGLAGRQHLDLPDRPQRRLRMSSRHLRRDAAAEEQERNHRPARSPQARRSACGDARNTAACVAATVSTRGRVHPALDACRQAPTRPPFRRDRARLVRLLR
jgi:hypothetical protein